ncbi:efflux RND transporter periplasmic adaptor subunit [Aquabacter sp. CN5-332]|uniref:efflux RND transporter periplasmic adaptor subunit n=1 Tax=Aquabacter sp. CN5-332 TaxID=3156608 RepID=UPI0032B4B782
MLPFRRFLPILAFIAAPGIATAQSPSDVDVRAQLTPRYATILSSEIVGRIISLPVREGETFQKGQELVGIDCASYRAKLGQADAQVSRTERKLEAFRFLDKRGATGKVELDLAEIDVEAARAEKELAAIDVSRCSILAPFSGSVAELKVKNHQYVNLGEPIVEILSDRELEVELLAPSRWLVWLKRGTRFRVRIDELGRDFPAVVTRLGAHIDPVSQSVKVYAQVEGDFPDLAPGMSGLAHFQAPTPATAETAPTR